MAEEQKSTPGAAETPAPAGSAAPVAPIDPKDDATAAAAPVGTGEPVDAAGNAAARGRKRGSGEGSGRKRSWLVILIGVLIVVALAALSYWAYQTVVERRLAVERLERATQLVEDADVVVIEVDEIVRTPIESSVGVRADAALDMIPGARGDLEEATSLIALATPALSEEDSAAAAALGGSADARLEMLKYGDTILRANSQAASAMEHALSGWDLIIEAEKLSDDAVKEYNKLTDASVKQSKKLAGEAKAKAAEAKTSFEKAQEALPEADYSAYIAYADAKIAALGLSINADDAYLADKPTEANKFNDQYNEAEKKLIAMAKALPASPVEPIKTAYEAAAADATEQYYAARDRATASDALIQETAPAPE